MQGIADAGSPSYLSICSQGGKLDSRPLPPARNLYETVSSGGLTLRFQEEP